MLNPDTIERLKKDPFFQEFQHHFLEIAQEINSVDGLKELPNEQAGEQAKIRLEVSRHIVELFNPFLVNIERQKRKDEEIMKVKAKFGFPNVG